jgi:hypothetical protein
MAWYLVKLRDNFTLPVNVPKILSEENYRILSYGFAYVVKLLQSFDVSQVS